MPRCRSSVSSPVRSPRVSWWASTEGRCWAVLFVGVGLAIAFGWLRRYRRHADAIAGGQIQTATRLLAEGSHAAAWDAADAAAQGAARSAAARRRADDHGAGRDRGEALRDRARAPGTDAAPARARRSLSRGCDRARRRPRRPRDGSPRARPRSADLRRGGSPSAGRAVRGGGAARSGGSDRSRAPGPPRGSRCPQHDRFARGLGRAPACRRAGHGVDDPERPTPSVRFVFRSPVARLLVDLAACDGGRRRKTDDDAESDRGGLRPHRNPVHLHGPQRAGLPLLPHVRGASRTRPTRPTSTSGAASPTRRPAPVTTGTASSPTTRRRSTTPPAASGAS